MAIGSPLPAANTGDTRQPPSRRPRTPLWFRKNGSSQTTNKLYTNLRSQGCTPYISARLKGSFVVYSLVACTVAPVPSDFDQVKFCWVVRPCQPFVFSETYPPL